MTAKLSLLDLADKSTTDWYVVYGFSQNPRWWDWALKRGFEHVQLWKPVYYGPTLRDKLWVVVDPSMQYTAIGATFESDPPWVQDKSLTVQHVVAARGTRSVFEMFSFGPVTCVEIAKACLGICSWWMRTPWQLYKHIAARGGVLISR